MDHNSLIAKDIDFDGIQLSDDGACRLCVDHVLVSSSLLHRIREITVVSSGANLSDHRPICVMLDCAQAHPQTCNTTCSVVLRSGSMAQGYSFSNSEILVTGG